MTDSNRLDQLRAKRARLAEAQENVRLRALHGPALATAVARATRQPITLRAFDQKAEGLLTFDWPTDLRLAPGLVAAYVGKSEAAGLLARCEARLKVVNGVIGFHEKTYLGGARLVGVQLSALLELAESTEESVLLEIDAPHGILLVDFYPTQGSEPFSIVAQGEALVEALGPCFPRYP